MHGPPQQQPLLSLVDNTSMMTTGRWLDRRMLGCLLLLLLCCIECLVHAVDIITTKLYLCQCPLYYTDEAKFGKQRQEMAAAKRKREEEEVGVSHGVCC